MSSERYISILSAARNTGKMQDRAEVFNERSGCNSSRSSLRLRLNAKSKWQCRVKRAAELDSQIDKASRTGLCEMIGYDRERLAKAKIDRKLQCLTACPPK